MNKIATAFGATPRALPRRQEPVKQEYGQCTSSEFLIETGIVIVICLALAMLAQLLVMFVGEY